MEKLANELDSLASFFEEEGYLKEAYALDVVSNTLVSAVEGSRDYKSVVKDLGDIIGRVFSTFQKYLEKLESMDDKEYNRLNSIFRMKFTKVKPLLVQAQKSYIDGEQKTLQIIREVS